VVEKDEPSSLGAGSASRGSNTMRGGNTVAAAVAVVVGLALLLARQARLHGIDSDYLVQQLQAGDLQQYRRHVLFMPLAGQVFGWLRPFGISAFVTLQLISALGVAVGVAASHRAATIFIAGTPGWRDRAGPMAIAIAVAVTPAVVYYGTAVELHGCFFAGVGLAWWAFARWWAAPSFAGAALVGAAAGLAMALHACGAVLPAGFLLTAMALGRGQQGALLQLAAGALLLVPLVMLTAALGTGCGAAEPMDRAVRWLQEWGTKFSLPSSGAVIAREWLWPFAPWSVLALIALFAARSRPWALAALAMVVVHLPIALVLLARDVPIVELGAYLLPAALPSALAAAALLSKRGFVLGIATAGLCSTTLLWPRWQSVYDEAFVTGVEALRAERSFTLLVDERELEAVRIEVADVLGLEVLRSIAAFDGGRSVEREELGQWLHACVALFAGAGAPLLVTDAAARVLATSSEPRLEWLARQFGSASYRQERFERAGLAGVVLLPR
jgi:hypothetical protein